MPCSASFSPIQAEFVSTIWPSSSSVPMARTSQRIRRNLGRCPREHPQPLLGAERCVVVDERVLLDREGRVAQQRKRVVDAIAVREGRRTREAEKVFLVPPHRIAPS